MVIARLGLVLDSLIVAAHLFCDARGMAATMSRVRRGRDDRGYKSNYRYRTNPSPHNIHYTLAT